MVEVNTKQPTAVSTEIFNMDSIIKGDNTEESTTTELKDESNANSGSVEGSELSGEGTDTSEEKPKYEPIHKRKKPKVIPYDRFKEVVHEKTALKNAAYNLLEEKKRLQEELQKTGHIANVAYEDSIKLRADLAAQIYEQAVEEGDVKKQADALRYMNQYESELRDQSKRYNEPLYHDDNDDILNYMDPLPQSTPYEDFITENDWCDPNSPYFDPDKREIAEEIAYELDRELRQNRMWHLKDTKEYYDLISNEVDKYMGNSEESDESDVSDDNNSDDHNEEYQDPKRPIQKVAAVTRSSYPTNFESSNSSNNILKVHLTDEEKEDALRLSYGTNLSEAEKIKRYADSKRARLLKERSGK